MSIPPYVFMAWCLLKHRDNFCCVTLHYVTLLTRIHSCSWNWKPNSGYRRKNHYHHHHPNAHRLGTLYCNVGGDKMVSDKPARIQQFLQKPVERKPVERNNHRLHTHMRNSLCDICGGIFSTGCLHQSSGSSRLCVVILMLLENIKASKLNVMKPVPKHVDFREPCSLHPEDRDTMVLRNVGILSQHYMASQPRKT
jgi:hypothetical protein